MASMLRSLGRIGRILVQCWPALLAWYLGGSVVRAAVLALAAPIGPQSALAALLIVPVAVLARLISYIGMFLVVRRAMRAYGEIAAGDVSFTSMKDAASEFLTVLSASILPFFAVYTLIGGLSADLSEYARAAFRYSLGSENNVVDVGNGPLVLAVVIVAFGGRMLLKKFGPRLPRWVAIAEIYLEATWVFVALSAVSALFGDFQEWINNRQIVFWFNSARDALTDLWTPIQLAITGIDWLVPAVLQLVLLPLAWLLVAGVVYTRALSTAVQERIVSVRLEARMRTRVAKLPTRVAKQLHLFSDEWEDIGGPIAMGGRMIARAGAVNLAIFVLLYGALFALSQWSTRWAAGLIGANDLGFWVTFFPALSLAIAAVVEPVRIALLAVMFDWCLRRWRDRQLRVSSREPTAQTETTAPTETTAQTGTTAQAAEQTV